MYLDIFKARSIDQYMDEVQKYPNLQEDEEKRLFELYREYGDNDAGKKIILSSLKFVVFIAKKYHRSGTSVRIDDLIQEGNVGLLHAVKNFDYTRPVRFTTYAVYHISSYIKDFWVKNFSVVKIATTKNDRKMFFNYGMFSENGREYASEDRLKEISSSLSIPLDEVREYQGRIKDPAFSMTLDSTVEDGSFLYDIEDSSCNPEDIAEELEMECLRKKVIDRINEVVDTLSDIDKHIVRNRLLTDEKKTYREIGETFGISLQAVQQRETRCKKIIQSVAKEFSEYNIF